MSWRRIAYTLIGIGFFIGGCLVLGALGGMWLDRRLGTEPFLALAGLTLGLIVAMFGIYRKLRRGMQEDKPKGEEKD